MSTTNQHPMNPEVSISGRRVTVSFDMPFMTGDECIAPNHYTKTVVSLGPEVAIRLCDNLARVEIHCGGAWYTANHHQLHGPSQFLPNMAALLDYWLSAKDRSLYEARLRDLRRLFADSPDALQRLRNRHLEMLQQEIDAAKAELGASIVASTQRVMELEAAMAKEPQS